MPRRRPAGPAPTPGDAPWQTIARAAAPKAAFRAHVAAALCADADDEGILDRLLDRLRVLRCAPEAIEASFGEPHDDARITVRLLPAGPTPDAALPSSAARVVAVHESISWQTPGGSYGYFGSGGASLAGGWEWEAIEDAERANAAFIEAVEAADKSLADVAGALDYGQNWLIWHPGARNALDEPALFFVSHGDCKAVPVTEAEALGFGSVLLRVLAESLLDESHFEATYN